jgi:hypothetical protein
MYSKDQHALVSTKFLLDAQIYEKWNCYMIRIKAYLGRIWVLLLSSLVVAIYLSAAYLPCIFPQLLCVPIESVNKFFSAASGIIGAVLVLFALNKTAERHRGRNLLMHFYELLSKPIGNTADVSITIPSLQFSAKGSSIGLTHIKNVTSLNELRDNVYVELAKTKDDLKTEIARVKDEIEEKINNQQAKMDEVHSLIGKLSSDISDIASGNTDKQLFGVFCRNL